MIFRRLARSTVVWSWIQNFFRLGSGLIILPLAMLVLSEAELGMYYVLLSLSSLALVVDFGFAPTVGRFISYATGGAEELAAHGIPKFSENKEPNYPLLWRLLHATRKLYRSLSIALVLLLGIGGTFYVENLVRSQLRVDPDFPALITRLAWAATILSSLLDIYFNWWCTFLRAMNEVRSAAQINTAAAAIRCGVAAALFLTGGGLLSLPIAGLVANTFQRHYARVRCLALLPAQPPDSHTAFASLFQVMWPNSWRLGIQLMVSAVATYGSTFICASLFGLDAAGRYGASVQLMAVASSMSYVWTVTKWPFVSQLRTRGDYAGIQKILWPRVWLQIFTFILLATAIVFIAPPALHWIGSGKELIAFTWLAWMAVNTFFELQLNTAGSLIATENRLPYLWHSVVANLVAVVLAWALARFTRLEIGGLVLAPLMVGCLFNYWYWPMAAARSINASLARFLFLGPAQTESATPSTY